MSEIHLLFSRTALELCVRISPIHVDSGEATIFETRSLNGVALE